MLNILLPAALSHKMKASAQTFHCILVEKHRRASFSFKKIHAEFMHMIIFEIKRFPLLK